MTTTFKRLKQDVLARMKERLPDFLSYHSVEHTELVIDRAEYIGKKEGLSKSELGLLKVAALYHDYGFTEVYQEHEQRGCEIVRKELPPMGYSKADIEVICGMIMATKIPQTPQNRLERVIADADLEYLGSNDFKPIGDKLLKELRHFNPDLTVKEWNEIQVKFMRSHHYHTPYCKRYRQWRKNQNLESIL